MHTTRSFGPTFGEYTYQNGQTLKPIWVFALRNCHSVDFSTQYFCFLGLYDCIEFRLMVYQEYQPFITEIFVPSSLIVLAAWLTFWIDKDSIPARVSLGGLCVIASITHSVGLVLGLRHNIEWHSVNIWLHTCIVFVVFALVEYGIVHSLVRRVHKKARTNSERLHSDSSTSYQVIIAESAIF